MTSILVVCTGNICRSPMAEGFLRDALIRRFGDRAPGVSSAGTIGWTGSPASPESVIAAGERGSDIESHQARELRAPMIEGADLILCMAGEHREAAVVDVPEAAARTFTLKELVRLLESLPPAPPVDDPDAFVDRIAAAHESRLEGEARNPHDEDISDPLGLPLDTYRAIAWELDGWNARLIDGLFGAEPGATAKPVEEAG
ncbi:MAG: arsenate reductase/protein-tyrosine-phosphatase family protein [Actinomycetota bacterium]